MKALKINNRINRIKFLIKMIWMNPLNLIIKNKYQKNFKFKTLN